MRALHYVGKGQLDWRDVSDPELIESTDAIVRPVVVAACDLDRGLFEGNAPPFDPPFVLGHEFVGVIEAHGPDVALAVGDVVLASFQPSCGTCVACRRGRTAGCTSVAVTAMYGLGVAGGDWSGAFADAVRVPWADFNLRRLPDDLTPAAAASASDNFADGLRGVDDELAADPGASVLVAGQGSIPLYAVAAARHLGSERVTYASTDARSLAIAEQLGADCVQVDAWPRRFDTHDITFDCTGHSDGLTALIRSTARYGLCTSASIYFHDNPTMPLREMYMKGARFQTGRVHSAAMLDRALELIADGLDPLAIAPVTYPWDEIEVGFRDAPAGAKLLFVR